jgi:hypothetical protein
VHHHRASCHLVTVADVSDLEADKIAAAQLAVDSHVEDSKPRAPDLPSEGGLRLVGR